jgi:hypothetical protein
VSRHRWGPPVVVEAPWSDTGGNLYTCLKCGLKRQSEPGATFFIPTFTFPGGETTTGKTPPCPGVVIPQKT